MCAELGILRGHDFKDLRWDTGSACASIGDVLRVHEWSYVRDLQNTCAVLASSGATDTGAPSGPGGNGRVEGAPLPDSVAAKPEAIGHLDGDTAISGGSFRAALAAAGAVIQAVDSVMAGEVQTYHPRRPPCSILALMPPSQCATFHVGSPLCTARCEVLLQIDLEIERHQEGSGTLFFPACTRTVLVWGSSGGLHAVAGAQRVLRGAAARAPCGPDGRGHLRQRPPRQPGLLPAQQPGHRGGLRHEPVQASRCVALPLTRTPLFSSATDILLSLL